MVSTNDRTGLNSVNAFGPRLPIALVLCLGAVFATCGDGQEGASSRESTAPTATGEKAPPPPLPELAAGLQRLSEGTFETTIQPGGRAGFDPLQLPLDTGVEQPSCAAFVFAFSWQVKDPYPPENVDVSWLSTRAGGPEEVASGASGTATVGCGFLETANNSTFAVTVQARYVIASTPP